jgi:3-phenylpropionate/cinnamic acid dioxygenase small subunit
MSYAEEAALITRTHALYCQLLDDLRFEDWGALFTEDAEWNAPSAAFRGRAAIVEGVSAMEPKVRGWVKHLSFAPVIEVEIPTSARAWSDFVVLTRDHENGAWSAAAAGRYYDEMQKEGDRWLFRSRAVDFDVAFNPLPDLAPVPPR